MIYATVKHLHIACVVISGTGFFLRGVLMLRGSPLLEVRWIRVLPHINDTVLLAAALGLTVITGQYPFVDNWVTAKVFGVMAYIVFGALALREAATRRLRIAFWLAALAVFAWIASVALTRHPAGFLAFVV